MRTTIELPDNQRAQLLELAARRGEKGFSGIIQEALELFLDGQSRAQAVQRAVASKGQLRGAEADELEAATRELRESWR